MKVTARHLQEQRDYLALCDAARRQNMPVSLDDPRSPRTVAALKDSLRPHRSV